MDGLVIKADLAPKSNGADHYVIIDAANVHFAIELKPHLAQTEERESTPRFRPRP